ncbi:MAG: hypothetical protein RL141_982 [Candidatus Parcubacteria bacterium]
MVAEMIQIRHTGDMSLLSRCAVLFFALFASTMCPAMAATQVAVAAEMEMGVDMAAQPSAASSDEGIGSPTSECCLGPMGEHGAGNLQGLMVSRVDGELGLVAMMEADEAWAVPMYRMAIPVLRNAAPPPDFDRRSVMKRE